MKNKKFIFALLTLCATFAFGGALTACGENGSSQESSKTQEESSSAIDLTGEKSIVADIEEKVGVYSTIDINKCYGLCNGYKFACKAEITKSPAT